MKKYLKETIACFSFLSILPILYVSIYSRPCVDDFDYSWRTYASLIDNPMDILSLIKAAIDTDIVFYNSWQGLYSSTLIMSLQPGIFSKDAYMLTTFFIMGAIFLSLSFVFITFRHYASFKKSTCCVIAFVVTCFLCQMMPSPVEGLYWFNGACNYIPFLGLVLVDVSLLYRAFNKNSKTLICYSSLVSFIISGANHVTSFINILILFMGIVLFIQKKQVWIFVIPFLFAVCGFALMYFAPGTTIRQSTFDGHADVITTMSESVVYSIELFGQWTTLSWGLFIIIVSMTACAFIDLKDLKIVNPFIVLIVLYGLFCAMLCVPFYPMWSFGAGRIHNIYFIAFNLFSMLFVITLMLYIKQKKKVEIINIERIKYLCFFATTIFIASFMLNPRSTSRKAINELRKGIAQAYANDFDQRLVTIEEAKKLNSKDTLVFKPLTKSELLRFDDITADVTDWRNKSFSRFYGMPAMVK